MSGTILRLVRLLPIAACLLVPALAWAEPEASSPTTHEDVESSAAMVHRLAATPNAGVEGRSVLLSMAVQGYASSQYLLGLMHLEGGDLPLDPAEAVKWLARAAGQRHEGALAHLADMAARGDIAAHLVLGLIARDIAGNRIAAARHLHAAAAAGDPQGLLALGELLSIGDAVEGEEADAAALFRSAGLAAMAAVQRARQGTATGILGPDSDAWLEIAVARTRAAPASPPDGEPGQAEHFARYWVGLMLLTGAETVADTPRGLALLRTAAEGGFALAEFSLSLLYERGHGVPRDLGLARRWLARADSHGHPLATARDHPENP